jgi:[ribosomal protein S18]-alanine N-acetyltransferase
MDIKIRPLTTADVAAVLDIHGKSFEDPWQDIHSLIHLHSSVGWIGIHLDEPVGFILWQLVRGEADVLSFAVLPEHRKQGVGRLLYAASEKAFSSQGITQIFLEVAQNNPVAIEFYKARGFIQTGVRKNYYSHNNQRVVNALTFSKTLKLE